MNWKTPVLYLTLDPQVLCINAGNSGYYSKCICILLHRTKYIVFLCSQYYLFNKLFSLLFYS